MILLREHSLSFSFVQICDYMTYSSYSGNKRDLGYETVATLIKHMEDERHQFAVIFARYSVEMERFMNMNPGLRDSIVFNVDFTDY